MKVYIESHGCDSKKADTNKVKTCLKENSATIVSDYREADYIILMSCGFNKIILEDNLNRIRQFAKTGAKIILGGCVPHIHKESRKMVDFYFGPGDLEKLDSIFKFKKKVREFSPTFTREDKKIIRVSMGCEGNCSYCAIRIANGRTKSRTIKEIRQDVKKGLEEGFQKFFFASEDVGSWGTDRGKNITHLLREVEKKGGNFKVTLTTFNPEWFLKFPELFDILKSDKIDKKLYLSLQSGSERILRLMRRKHTVEEYKKIFKKLKDISGMKIQTDVMVGFPTETEQDFKKTLKLVEDLDFYFLQVFLYTDMRNTAAEKIFPKVKREVAEERARRLIKAFLKKKENRNQERVLVNTNVKLDLG